MKSCTGLYLFYEFNSRSCTVATVRKECIYVTILLQGEKFGNWLLIHGGLVVYWLRCQSCDQQVASSTPGHAWMVSAWMSAGKRSRYVTGHLQGG